MRIFELMNDQIRLPGVGGHATEAEVAQRMRNLHRTVPLEVYAARTDEADSAVLQRLSESRQRYKLALGDHRAGVTLVDGLPQAGAELSSALPGSTGDSVVFEECELAGAIVNPFP